MAADRVSRRRALAGVATAGSLAVGGCLGGGGRQSLAVGVGPAGSRSHAAGHALAVAADRHSDSLQLQLTAIDSQSERLYGVDEEELAAAGVDNTTLYRASEKKGVFDLDPVEQLPLQGFAYGQRDHYWLAVASNEATPTSTAGFADEFSGGSMVYPGQPSEQSRLVAEQLLRDASLWAADRIDNRPTEAVPTAAENSEIDLLVAVQHRGRLAPWCRRLDEQVGDRLFVLGVGEEFQQAIERAPNAVAREIEPAGWERAELGGSADGWGVSLQWIWSPAVEPETVAELTRIAHEHTDTRRRIDSLAVGEPAALAGGVMPTLPVHEGAATVFEELGVGNSEWTVSHGAD